MFVLQFILEALLVGLYLTIALAIPTMVYVVAPAVALGLWRAIFGQPIHIVEVKRPKVRPVEDKTTQPIARVG